MKINWEGKEVGFSKDTIESIGIRRWTWSCMIAQTGSGVLNELFAQRSANPLCLNQVHYGLAV